MKYDKEHFNAQYQTKGPELEDEQLKLATIEISNENGI